MERTIYVPEYVASQGVKLVWEDEFSIESLCEDSTITIRANKEGLISLARHLLTLAEADVPVGSHIQFDEFNSLEDGSLELIIERI